jgi:hypothetical protein
MENHFIRFLNKTGMIGRLVEDPSPRPFFDFIIFAGSPGKGSGRVRRRDWGTVLSVELGSAVELVELLFVFIV